MTLSLSRALALLLVTGTFACSSGPATKTATPDPQPSLSLEAEGGAKSHHAPVTALTRHAAANRTKQVSQVSYTLWFGLDGSHDDFEGRTVIHFDLRPGAKDAGKKLLVDFEGGTVHSISVNEVALPAPDHDRYDGHHIAFKTSELLPGTNRIEIAFAHPYGKDGTGLYRFKDPVDGAVYLYSNFEPYDAHKMFPCFDQPDIKASFELTVESPEDWQVISNTLERDASTVDGRKSWAFPPSPVLSPYVFALHAGPYKMWKSSAEGIPIRLFARKSMAEYVDADEWLEITRKGLDFFGVQFGYPYPFSKYDQIIVPDFNAGAMENAGAVTFSEHYVYRTKVTQNQHRGRATTILHEMAHMWFGDLVTLRWWNGLWLNESFADFMSTCAVDQATSYPGAWQDFFAGSKEWAYWEDQLVTTHPVEVAVPDTDHALTQFDGITYGKGASILKQLRYFLGEDDFREGIQRYFQKYALRNTTIHDFMKMLAEASSQDLLKWQHSWLQTAGVNTVRANWSCAKDDQGKSKIDKFTLTQTAPTEQPELRTHRTEVALFQMKQGKFVTKTTIPVTYTKPETPVEKTIGEPCPDFVFPNYGDQDYAKIELDPVSLSAVTQNLRHVSDPLTRQMLWFTLWEMVVDGNMKTQDYIDVVLNQLPSENNTQIVSTVLDSVVEPSANRVSALKFLAGPARASYRARLEEFGKKHLQGAPAGSDLQLVWYRFFLDTASSPKSLELLHEWLSGKGHPSGLKIDQDKRWELVAALARAGAPDAETLIQKELAADSTDRGQKLAIAAEVSAPDSAIKKKWLDSILQFPAPASPQMTLAKLREAMRSFNLLDQEKLIQPLARSYFDELPKLSQSAENEEYTRNFARYMYPALCDPTIVQETTAFLDSHPRLPAPVMKALKVNRQEEERCVRARAKTN